ncbi:c-type cytochrome [Phenylobacterium sp.]|jgi:mono/diheme cytochrome c family protein|uniref:c-type cytochrome n=1 Tax=Phenylobacterium sp. TaxID=1871053 RepID=UPI002F936AB2
MKRVIRWAGLGLAGLVTVVLFAGLGAFAASEVLFRRSYPKAETQLVAARDPGAVERGRRVALINGCHDCHGKDLDGRMFHDEMPIFRGYGPNLTLAAAEQSDGELDSAIRHGVAADGRSLWIMPSEAFAELTDQETSDLLAYIRSFPVKGEEQPRSQIGPVGRLGLILGKFHSAPQMLRLDADRYRPDLGPTYAKGREVARACTECHGKDLRGREALKAPDLDVAAAYSPQDFATLLRTGVPPTGRDLGLMSGVARDRFSHLSDDEVAALYEYLRARADKGV